MHPVSTNWLVNRFTGKRPGIELTTTGSCIVRCTKHCPWEVFQKAYGHPDDMLTMENLKRILRHIPSGSFVKYAGFSEPLANPECLDLMQYTMDQGFPVKLFTTLHGLQEKDVVRLAGMPFLDVCLHLPDCYGVVRHPGYPWFNDAVMRIVQGQRKVYFSVMNDLFKTNHREDFCRGKRSPRWLVPRMCDKWIHPTFIVMPNGDCYFCCMDFRLQYRVGNLFEERYDDIVKRCHIPFDLCRVCCEGVSISKGVWSLLRRDKHGYVF